MELHSDEPRVVGELHYLDELFIGRHSRDVQPVRGQHLAVGVIEFVAVAVALVDELLAVYLTAPLALGQLAGVKSEAHRAALFGDVPLLVHNVDDGIGSITEFG